MILINTCHWDYALRSHRMDSDVCVHALFTIQTLDFDLELFRYKITIISIML